MKSIRLNKIFYKENIGLFGLFLNFIGGLLIVFSSIKNPYAWVESLDKSKKFYYSVIDSRKLIIGLILMTIGFLFQIFERLGREK